MRRILAPAFAIMAAVALAACNSGQLTYGAAEPNPAPIYGPNMIDR